MKQDFYIGKKVIFFFCFHTFNLTSFWWCLCWTLYFKLLLLNFVLWICDWFNASCFGNCCCFVVAENGVLLFMKQVLQLRQGTASGGLTIKELNDLLDQLSSSENRFTVFALIVSPLCYLCTMFQCLLDPCFFCCVQLYLHA